MPEGGLQVPRRGLSEDRFVIQSCCPRKKKTPTANLYSKDAIVVIF